MVIYATSTRSACFKLESKDTTDPPSCKVFSRDSLPVGEKCHQVRFSVIYKPRGEMRGQTSQPTSNKPGRGWCTDEWVRCDVQQGVCRVAGVWPQHQTTGHSSAEETCHGTGMCGEVEKDGCLTRLSVCVCVCGCALAWKSSWCFNNGFSVLISQMIIIVSPCCHAPLREIGNAS